MANDPRDPNHPSETPAPAMQAALGRLWIKFLPEIENRLAIVEDAADALSAGELTGELREQAHQAAHKLAGVLGTFGLTRGTELARQAEELLVDLPPRTAAAGLSEWVGGLRMLIESRN
jgi:HPt (histidine-containing phosphotransfer) domain-containing protein